MDLANEVRLAEFNLLKRRDAAREAVMALMAATLLAEDSRNPHRRAGPWARPTPWQKSVRELAGLPWRT